MSRRDEGALSGPEWIVFAVVSLANLVPIWAFRYFPGQDTPNHLYAVEVTRVLLDGSAPGALAATFVPQLALKSNVLFHLLMLALCRLGLSLGLAHRLILSSYALAFPLAGLSCARAANPRGSALALLLLPLVWNWFALQGLYNYLLSLVPALIWLGIVARDAGRPGRAAQLALLLAAFAVYLGHAGTFIALLFVTVLRVIHPGDGSRLPVRIRLAAASRLAWALGPTIVLAAAGMGGLLRSSAHAEPTVSGWEAYGPLEAAGAFFVELAMRYHPWELALLGPPLGALIAIPLAAARAERRRSENAASAPGTGSAASAPGAPRWPLHAALALTILYFSLPHIFHGSDVSPRLRPLIVFCLLCYGGVTLSPLARRRVAALALASGVLGSAALSWDFARLNRDLRDFTSGIPLIPEGSRVYPMVFDPRGPSVLVRPFLHAWGYYGVDRHVVTPFAFAWHETRFPFRYRQLPLHTADSRLPSDGEDEPYALVQGRLCQSVRRLTPSLDCAAIRAETEARLARLGTSYDYLLTWAAPADFASMLYDRGYRIIHARGMLALYEPPASRL